MSDPRRHLTQPIPKADFDVEFLVALVEGRIQINEEECGAVEGNQCRTKYCRKYIPIKGLLGTYKALDYAHAQGVGRLEKASCDVIFHWLVPQENTVPYIVFFSYGVHKHPPPPPQKPPQEIIQGLMDIISEHGIMRQRSKRPLLKRF